MKGKHGRVSKVKFSEMQQAFGITFDMHGLVYSDVEHIAKVPETRFCDWMHIMCASGRV